MTRIDQRKPDELRPLRILPGFLPRAWGSAYVEWGHTRVLVTVHPEDRVPPFVAGTGMGWVRGEYSLLTRSGGPRVVRGWERNTVSGRALEIGRFIGRSLRAAVDLERLGERTLWVDCNVLDADGGTRVASVTGGWVALFLAGERLVREGRCRDQPVREQVAGVSLGYVRGRLLSDMNYFEDQQADCDANVVMTAGGGFVELQITAEHDVLAPPRLHELLNRAWTHLRDLFRLQREVLRAALPEPSSRSRVPDTDIPETLPWRP